MVHKQYGDALALQGVLHQGADVDAPRVSVRYTENVMEYTAAHIPAFGRWYVVDEWHVDANDRFTASLSLDLASTYAEDIDNAMADMVEGDDVDGYASNRNDVYDTRTALEKTDFPLSPLHEDGSIIMITLKGRR